MFHTFFRILLVAALCGLWVQPSQAEPADSLAVEAEHHAATPQKTEPKEITIHIRAEHKAIVSALVDAVDEETTITGVADLDALSATYGLMGIDRMGRMSPFYGYRFRLMFPPDADVTAIAGAYWNLPYIQSVEPKPPGRSFDGFDDIENRGLRLLAKIAVGTASGVVFTAMSTFVMATTQERTGDADAHGTIGSLLAGGAIGCSVGFPWGVSKVDPYDSLPTTLLAGVIPASALLRANQQSEGIAFLAIYVVPIISSLIASELSRKPPQDRRVSFGLASTLNGGLSAVTMLRF